MNTNTVTKSSKTLPDLQGPNALYWVGANEGKVVVQVCAACRTTRYPAANLCPHCHAGESTWQAIRPTGSVLSWCRFHRMYFPEFQERLPYTVLLVQMDDGVKFYGNYRLSEMQKIPAIGQRVEAVFEVVEDGNSVVRFRDVAGEVGA